MIGEFVPLVFDETAEIYNRYGINFSALSHLASIGLVRFDALAGFVRKDVPKRAGVSYYDRVLVLEMPHDAGNDLKIGRVLLTKIGQEFAPICGSKPVEGFREYAKDRWIVHLPKSE